MIGTRQQGSVVWLQRVISLEAPVILAAKSCGEVAPARCAVGSEVALFLPALAWNLHGTSPERLPERVTSGDALPAKEVYNLCRLRATAAVLERHAMVLNGARCGGHHALVPDCDNGKGHGGGLFR